MNSFSSHHAPQEGRHRRITVRRVVTVGAVLATIVGAPLVVRALAADDGGDDPSTAAGGVVSDQGSYESGDDTAPEDRTNLRPRRVEDPDATARHTEEAVEQATHDQVAADPLTEATDLDESADTVADATDFDESADTVADATDLDEPVDPPAETMADEPVETDAEPAVPATETTVPATDDTEPDPAAVPQLDRLEFLTASYTWDERNLRVAALQEVLDVEVDGWYGPETRLLHLQALQLEGLGTDGVPDDAPSGPSADQWAALRDCESGGDYSIASSSGRYRGAYQFAVTTWDSVAGRNNPSLVGVDPAVAAPADQDAMARALYIEAGHGPWPVCGRHLR